MARRYEIDGKVVLITGAAHGIGRNAAERLAKRGARLALIDLDADRVERLASELGAKAEPFVADVADRDSILPAIEAARERFGGIDVAVANAGIAPKPPTPSSATPYDAFERVIQVNLLGVWHTLRAVLPDVIERRGYLLPIASVGAAVPVPFAPAYGASKAAVHSLARTLRFELAHTGVRVGCGYFGFIDTEMTRHAFADPRVVRAQRYIPPGIRRWTPVGAAGKAIVRGIERRSRRVYRPAWVGPVVSFNSMGAPLEWLAARDPRVSRTLRRAREEAEAALPEARQPKPKAEEVRR